MKLVENAMREQVDYNPARYAGAIATQAREYHGMLKWTERIEYQRIKQERYVFEAYVTEGDGLRRAARERCPVFDIGGQNAAKQSDQLRRLTREFMKQCPT